MMKNRLILRNHTELLGTKDFSPYFKMWACNVTLPDWRLVVANFCTTKFPENDHDAVFQSRELTHTVVRSFYVDVSAQTCSHSHTENFPSLCWWKWSIVFFFVYSILRLWLEKRQRKSELFMLQNTWQWVLAVKCSTIDSKRSKVHQKNSFCEKFIFKLRAFGTGFFVFGSLSKHVWK